MGFFDFINRQKPAIIQRDEQAYNNLIWVHPDTEFMTGSTIELKPNEIAVFYDMYKNESFVISRTTTLTTNNIPILSSITNMMRDGVSRYQGRVYFMRLTESPDIQWGTPSQLGPYRIAGKEGLRYTFRANGTYKFKISDPEKVLKLVDGDRFIDFNNFESERVFNVAIGYFRRKVDQIANAVMVDFDILKVFIDNASNAFKEDLQTDVFDEYGLTLTNFNIISLLLPEDPNDRYNRYLDSVSEERGLIDGLNIQGIRNYLITHSIRIGEQSSQGSLGGVTGIGIGNGIGGSIGNLMQSAFGNIPQSAMEPMQGNFVNTNPFVESPISPNNFGDSTLTSNPNPTSTFGSNGLPLEAIQRIEQLKNLCNQGILSQPICDARINDILKEFGL